MKNLNRFRKAELINKLKDLQNKTTNKSSLIVEYILFFKSLILKITLIALLIKIFRKYKIFRVL
jgi:hypothetical protein